MDTSKQINDFSKKLDIIVKLLALSVVGNGNQKEQISKLLSAGLTATQVADVLGKSVNLITAYSSQIKKSKAQKTKNG